MAQKRTPGEEIVGEVRPKMWTGTRRSHLWTALWRNKYKLWWSRIKKKKGTDGIQNHYLFQYWGTTAPWDRGIEHGPGIENLQNGFALSEFPSGNADTNGIDYIWTRVINGEDTKNQVAVGWAAAERRKGVPLTTNPLLLEEKLKMDAAWATLNTPGG